MGDDSQVLDDRSFLVIDYRGARPSLETRPVPPTMRGIADAIDAQIRRGEGPAGVGPPPGNLAPGCRLRSRTELADLYGASQSTVFTVTELLKERRLVRGEPGRSGLVVRPSTDWLPVPPPDTQPG